MATKPKTLPESDVVRLRHRRIARRVLFGHRPERIAREEGVKERYVTDLKRRLEETGWAKGNKFLTSAQVGIILNVRPRRVRSLCDEGRMGQRMGSNCWLITYDELADYLKREHLTGAAGRQLARDERPDAEDD